jgi:hypothetical protein
MQQLPPGFQLDTQPAAPMRAPGVIRGPQAAPDPMQVQSIDRQNRAEARQEAQSTFRTMTPEEVTAQGLPAGGVYQVNGLGEIKTVRAAPSATEAAKTQAQDSRAAKLQGLLKQLDRAEGIYRDQIKGGIPNPISGRLFPLSEGNSAFQAAASSAAQQAFSAFRVPGEGPQSDADLRLFTEANRPLPTDTEASIEEKFRAVRSRALAELEALGVGVGDTDVVSPLAVSTPTRAAGEGENFLTTDQQDLLRRFTQAYDSGASLEQLRAIAATPFQTQAELDAARAAGRRPSLSPAGRDPRADMSTLESIGETITGSARSTPEIEALPDWTNIPVNADMQGFLASLGTITTGPDETAQILLAQGVATAARRDDRGNIILTGTDGREYAIKPGFRASDIPRAIGGIAAFTPAGRASTAAGSISGGALTQLGIEGTQALAGGSVDPAEVVLAGGGNLLGQQLGRGVSAVRNARAARAPAPDAPLPPEPQVQAPIPQQAPSPVAAADEIAAPITPEAQTEIGTIARQAIGRGKPARDAQAKLAVMAQVDPEAKAAAERIGIELPVDVLSNDARLLTVTGLARSQIGSEAQTAWGQTVTQAIEQSDDTLRAIGATRDLAQVSESIRGRLVKDIDDLEARANVLRREVDGVIDVQSRVSANALQRELGKTINDLGGIDEAKQAFSAEEKKLLAMLGEGEQAKMPTYARLNQLRDQIGRALFKNQGPWVDAPTATLKRYYGALADDQIAHIEAVAGKDIADKMRGSNDLYSQMFKARDSMKTVYGKSLEKDIGPLIKTAITTGSKGNGEALRRLMAAVPEDARSQTLLSGIFSLSERQSAQGGFSFAEYAKLYKGLRQNGPIYDEVAKTIGKDSERILSDLYLISRRIAAAENKIVRTGASNQPLLNALNAENLVGKVASSAAKRTAVTGAMSIGGGVAGGPIGAGIAGGMAEAIQQASTQAGKSNLDKLHSVLVSEPFQNLVEKVANGTVKPSDVNRLANDRTWARFAKTALGIETPAQRRAWISAAMAQSANTSPEAQPAPMIEIR